MGSAAPRRDRKQLAVQRADESMFDEYPSDGEAERDPRFIECDDRDHDEEVKCASIDPPDRCTTTLETTINPTPANALRVNGPKSPQTRTEPKIAGTAPSATECTMGYPRSSANGQRGRLDEENRDHPFMAYRPDFNRK